MSHPALALIAGKAKLAGAVVAGGLIATAAVGGGAMALSPVADSDPAVAVPTDSPAPAESASPTAVPTPTDTATVAVLAATPEATESPDGGVRVNMNHATVVSIDATSLVVTVDGTSYTWVLTDQTHYSGFYKDPTQVKPGMVLNVHGVQNGAAYQATNVTSPGHNKPKHVKPAHKTKSAKPAKEHGKRH